MNRDEPIYRTRIGRLVTRQNYKYINIEHMQMAQLKKPVKKENPAILPKKLKESKEVTREFQEE